MLPYESFVYFASLGATTEVGRGTGAKGTLDRLFTRPCGTSLWHSQHNRSLPHSLPFPRHLVSVSNFS